MVIWVSKAKALPDAPATQQQMAEWCEPVELKVVWGDAVSVGPLHA
jgi:hypothetical protein